ncbi:MAG: dephospho-CoA kinase [Pseudomonadota bacterium]
MIRVGLTGSIAMGKSTTADMFRDEGAPVHDADAAVHELYGPGGAASEPLRALVPSAVSAAGVDREALKAAIAEDPALLGRIEAAIHPLVKAHRDAFERAAEADDQTIILFDVPLLFETGADQEMDAVVVVTAPAEVQKARALARPGMTEAHLDRILARQTPDAEKRARADYLVETHHGLEVARAQVRKILSDLRQKAASRS